MNFNKLAPFGITLLILVIVVYVYKYVSKREEFDVASGPEVLPPPPESNGATTNNSGTNATNNATASMGARTNNGNNSTQSVNRISLDDEVLTIKKPEPESQNTDMNPDSPSEIKLKLNTDKTKLLITTPEFTKMIYNNSTSQDKEESITLNDVEINRLEVYENDDNLTIGLEYLNTESVDNLSDVDRDTLTGDYLRLTIENPSDVDRDTLREKWYKTIILPNKETLAFRDPVKVQGETANPYNLYINLDYYVNDDEGKILFMYERITDSNTTNPTFDYILPEGEELKVIDQNTLDKFYELQKPLPAAANPPATPPTGTGTAPVNSNAGNPPSNFFQTTQGNNSTNAVPQVNVNNTSMGRSNSVNTVVVRIDQKLKELNESNKRVLTNLLYKINPNGNVTQQLEDVQMILSGEANPNGMDLVFKSNVDSVLEGQSADLKANIKVVIDLLVGMSDKRFQNMMVSRVIDKLQNSKQMQSYRNNGLVSSLARSSTNPTTRRGATNNGGFTTMGNEGIPEYNSNNATNRTTNSNNKNNELAGEMAQIRQLLFNQKFRNELEDDKKAQEMRRAGFDYQPQPQQQAPTIVKQTISYPEQSVYSGYGRPKMMTEIDPHMQRPDKPPACIPQEKMPKGPVPMFEHANVADYTGVGSMLPVFVYDESFDKRYYKRLYEN